MRLFRGSGVGESGNVCQRIYSRVENVTVSLFLIPQEDIHPASAHSLINSRQTFSMRDKFWSNISSGQAIDGPASATTHTGYL